MSMTLDEVEAAARKLPAEERARLVDAILGSLQEAPSPEIEAAWQREIEARVAAYDRGEMRAYPADEVLAELRAPID